MTTQTEERRNEQQLKTAKSQQVAFADDLSRLQIMLDGLWALLRQSEKMPYADLAPLIGLASQYARFLVTQARTPCSPKHEVHFNFNCLIAGLDSIKQILCYTDEEEFIHAEAMIELIIDKATAIHVREVEGGEQ